VTKKLKVIVWIAFISTAWSFENQVYAQNKNFILSAKITDSETKQPVQNASVVFSGLAVGTVADSNGYFVLKLPKGNYQMAIRSLSYKLTIKRFSLEKDTLMYISMQPTEQLLGEVVISVEKPDANISRSIMGLEKISGKVLKKLPTLMGEKDVIRSIMLLPGISTVGEGASGFNVRGGNVDQNLILLDGVPLFNTSHLFGFFTGFNSDMVQDLSLYKSGIPARFGGRASSVLDVRLKEGDYQKWAVTGGLGPISSRLMVEGPIIKDKTSLLIGTRLSFSDFYLKFFPDPELKKSKANFYDINFKLTHKLSKNQKLSFSVYNSNDGFRFGTETNYFWNTINGSVKHDIFFKNNLSSSFTAFVSKYSYGISGNTPSIEYIWQPSITQKSIKENFTWQLSERSKIDFGAEINTYINDAGQYGPGNENSKVQSLIMPVEHSRDFSVNMGHTVNVNEKLNLDYGLRYTVFQLVGPGTFNIYQPGTPRDVSTLLKTVSYNKNELVKTYQGFEPRVSLALKLNDSQSFKIGYNRMQQFMHLLSNTMAVSPADIWKNSDLQLPQQMVDQYAIGYFRNWNLGMYESSVEAYYKNNKNVIDYIDGADLYLNPLVETQLLIGQGNAYGIEFFLKKVRGVRLTGWVSYTYSRSFRQVIGNTEQNAANFGLKFPSNFDNPNNFKLVLNNRLTNRLSFNANFNYSTGRPITYPNGRYKLYAYNDVYDYLNDNNLNPRPGLVINSYIRNGQTYYFLNNGKVEELLDGYSVPSFSLRNAERIPDYIRLDLGITLDPKPNSKFNSSWNFSIYNMLGRQNVYSIYFRSSTGLRNQAKTFKLSILGAAIPSITYNFKF